MGFDTILNAIITNGGGLIGILLVVMLWFNYTLVTKLFKVIETNSKVITEVTTTLCAGNKLIEENSEIVTKHQNEDQRHRDQCERTHNEVHAIKVMLTDTNQTLEQIKLR